MQSQRRRMAKGKQKQMEEDYDIDQTSGMVGFPMMALYIIHG